MSKQENVYFDVYVYNLERLFEYCASHIGSQAIFSSNFPFAQPFVVDRRQEGV